MGQVFTCGYDLYNHEYNLYTRGWDVFTCKNVLCTFSYVFYSHGCNKFLHAKTFFYIRWYHFYSHVCNVFTCRNVLYTRSICLLFPWVQCQSLKPVLSQCSQTGFVTADDFIALYTRSYVFYSHGCNKFLYARTFFTLADTIAPIFTVLSEVWPHANPAMVTNNSSVLTEVRVNQLFPVLTF